MGTVFEARHRTLPRKFAIKILKPDLARDASFTRRFRREAIAAGSIEHPNIIYITDFGETDGSLYLVMEYLEGQGLDEVLSRNVRLPLTRAIPILAQIADALDTAHNANVVHRDLKPENILLNEVRGYKDVVKIFDFGIARVLSEPETDTNITQRGQVFGTAEYMSPEQATGAETDGRADIYAVGCLAYELITGDPPFLGEPLDILRMQVKKEPPPPSSRLRDYPLPPAVDALVLRCLAKKPSERFQSAAELRQELLKIRGLVFGMTPEVQPGTKKPPPSRQALERGWRKLESPTPDIFDGGDSPVIGGTLASGQGQRTNMQLDRLRDAYHQVLREVAISLMRAVLTRQETSEMLERLLAAEEEMASLSGTIALAEQNFDRIRFDTSHRENQLRYAILDLGVEHADLQKRLKAHPDQQHELTGQINDLVFQINELNARTKEVEVERGTQIDELNRSIADYRMAKQDLEREVVAIYQRLQQQVEDSRPKAVTNEPAKQLYERLDRARAALDNSRRL